MRGLRLRRVSTISSIRAKTATATAAAASAHSFLSQKLSASLDLRRNEWESRLEETDKERKKETRTREKSSRSFSRQYVKVRNAPPYLVKHTDCEGTTRDSLVVGGHKKRKQLSKLFSGHPSVDRSLSVKSFHTDNIILDPSATSRRGKKMRLAEFRSAAPCYFSCDSSGEKYTS